MVTNADGHHHAGETRLFGGPALGSHLHHLTPTTRQFLPDGARPSNGGRGPLHSYIGPTPPPARWQDATRAYDPTLRGQQNDSTNADGSTTIGPAKARQPRQPRQRRTIQQHQRHGNYDHAHRDVTGRRRHGSSRHDRRFSFWNNGRTTRTEKIKQISTGVPRDLLQRTATTARRGFSQDVSFRPRIRSANSGCSSTKPRPSHRTAREPDVTIKDFSSGRSTTDIGQPQYRHRHRFEADPDVADRRQARPTPPKRSIVIRGAANKRPSRADYAGGRGTGTAQTRTEQTVGFQGWELDQRGQPFSRMTAADQDGDGSPISPRPARS